MGQIVHDLDLKENRYATPEAPAMDRMVSGLQQLHDDDHVLLQLGIEMFAALANSFSASESIGPRASRPGYPNKKRRSGPGKRRQTRS
jgi:hypothetical protein